MIRPIGLSVPLSEKKDSIYRLSGLTRISRAEEKIPRSKDARSYGFATSRRLQIILDKGERNTPRDNVRPLVRGSGGYIQAALCMSDTGCRV